MTVHETIRVKSAAWDAGGNALLYSTLNHVKYALPEDGDGGVVRTLDGEFVVAFFCILFFFLFLSY